METAVYKCPFIFRCNCRVKFQITTERDCTVLEQYGVHTKDSHIHDHSKYLNKGQVSAIKDIVRQNPMLAPNAVRRNLKNMSDDATHVPTHLKRSVVRLVAKERDVVLS